MTQLLSLKAGKNLMDKTPLIVLLGRLFGPNFLIAINVVLVGIYWQSGPTGISPSLADGHWKEIAVSALGVIGVIGSWTMRLLHKKFSEFEENLKTQNNKQDLRHAQNTKALVQIITAMKTGETDKLDVGQLFDPGLM